MERALVVILVVLGAILLGPVVYLGHAFLVTSEITLHQIIFWCVAFFGVLAIAYVGILKSIPWKLTGSLWLAFGFVYYTTGMFYLSGIADKSNINAQAVGGVWEESYTSIRTETVCDSRDKDGACTSSHTVDHCDNRHPDSYEIHFSDGSEHTINRGNYRSLVGKMSNEKQESIYHAGQCSIGDGRKFVTRYVPGSSAQLYVSYEIPVVNYLLAGRNIYQLSEAVSKPYLPMLQKVPELVEHSAGIGPWQTHRVLVAGTTVPQDWKQQTDATLNEINGTLGPSKQVNVVLYVTGAAERGFRDALEAYWVHGRKNQLTVIVSSSSFPKVEWVDVIDFWSNKPEIRINLRDKLEKVSLDSPEFTNTIREEVIRNWDRRQMKTFKYLARELMLPWWGYLLVFVFSATMSYAFSLGIHRTVSNRY